MQWEGRQESGNIRDVRGAGPGLGFGGGRGGPIAVGGGLGTLIILALLGWVVLGDPLALMRQGGPQGDPQGDPFGGQQQAAPGKNDEVKKFIGVVLKDTEDVWHEQFKKMGKRYQEPKLVLFSGRVDSGCGPADKGVGPFYCPTDQTIYIDPTFFVDMERQLKAPGDFARAYVIAHEVGHHVQNQLGRLDEAHQLQQAFQRKGDKPGANAVQVRVELQADFYAGVYAHHVQRTKKVLEAGDMDEAINAAEAIGDDRLQKQVKGFAIPHTFTHGTSEQRKRWLKKGFESGDITQGDTFSAKDL